MSRIFMANSAPVTDAKNWPLTVTQTITLDHTDDDEDRTITTTGSATFVYQRVLLGDLLARPNLMFTGFGDEFGPLADNGDPEAPRFAVVQCAAGGMPGWMADFRPTKKKDATTIHTVFKKPDHNTGIVPEPTTTHADILGGLTMGCAPCAPGRFVFIGDFETDQPVRPAFLSLNAGFYADNGFFAGGSGTVLTGDVDVSLLYAGVAADPTNNQPEIASIYRVTLPADVRFLCSDNLGLQINGEHAGYNALYSSFVGTLLDETLSGIVGYFGGPKIGDYAVRSPWMADVQMRHYGDVLTSGPVDYCGVRRNESYIVGNGLPRQVLDDPFNLAGQSFSHTDAAAGFTVTVHF